MKYKNNLFQYDQNQTITNVDGLFVDYILNDETLRVPVVDGNAIIPNEVLAVAGMHYAYVCLANETRLEFRFKVTARVAPPDVPYAPSHAITFDDLVKTVQDEVKSLEERAASGEFDGKDGKDYVITPADYDAIAERVTLEGVVKTVNHVAPDAEGNVDVQGGGETTDVQLNGVSITKDGVANIPVAGETLGVVKVQSNGVYGIESIAGGHVAIKTPTTKEITDRAPYKAVTLEVLDDAVSTSLNKPKKSSGSIDTWASARKNMKAQTEFTAGTNLEWVEEQTTLGKKYTLNAAGYDDTEIKGQIEALDGSVVKTVNGVAPVDGNVDVQGGGSSVTMADNAQGGVDLTVDGSTKTLAKEGELATIKADLSQLEGEVDNKVGKTDYATDNAYGIVRTSTDLGTSTVGSGVNIGKIMVSKATDSNIINRNSNYKPIVPNNLDLAVKSAMCDGKGASWSDTEKANARARMGIGELELIETIDVTENSSTFIRDVEPNGTPYNFKKMYILISLKIGEPASGEYLVINYYYGDTILSTYGAPLVQNNRVIINDNDGISIKMMEGVSYPFIFMALDGNITKINMRTNSSSLAFGVGTKIKIYGVRA